MGHGVHSCGLYSVHSVGLYKMTASLRCITWPSLVSLEIPMTNLAYNLSCLCHVLVCWEQAENKLNNLSKKELEVVEKLSKGIVNKMLHGPMSALRQPDGPEEKKMTLKLLKDMFKLEKL